MNRTLALTNLLLVLVSGVLLRAQWTWPVHAVFDSRYLIHAHSHLALLGWLLPMVFERLAPGAFSRPWVALYHVLVWAMSLAFLMQGYAMASITLSTLVMMLGSIGAVRVHAMAGMTGKAAIVVMWVSNLGPVALGAGAFMGPDWIRGWVTYYLHLQFSGWITLAVLAAKPVARQSRAVAAIVLGAALLMEPYFRTAGTPLWLQSVGLAGGVLTVAGTLDWLRQVATPDSSDLALFGKSLLQLLASIPVIGLPFMTNHSFAIGFAHLVLVAMATHRLMPARRAGVFLAGIWSMLGALFLQGFGSQFGLVSLPHPQFLLFLTGVVTLAGALIRLIPYPFTHTSIQTPPL
jgi:hypothetical protein